jgi:hypothetical protein
MLSTLNNQAFNFSYDSTTDSTVYVSPGVAVLNSYVAPFRGDSISFSQMTDFSTSSNVYQYSALSLYYDSVYVGPDLTCNTSSGFDTTRAPSYPNLGIDASVIHPIGLFLFYRQGTSDGTTTELVSASKVS